jgi:hypothetical protein
MRVMTIGLLTAGLWLLSGQSGAAQQQQQGGMCGMPPAQASAPGAPASGCPCMRMMAMMMGQGGMMGMPGGTQGTPEQGGTPTPQPQQPPPQ